MHRSSRWLIAIYLVGALVGITGLVARSQSPSSADSSGKSAAELAVERQKLDQTLWASEVEAQRHERVFIDLWDKLRDATDKFQPLADFPFTALIAGTAGQSPRHDWGIRVTPLVAPGRRLTASQFRDAINDFRRAGYRIIEGEWHHSQFEPGGSPDRRAQSVVAMTLHVSHPGREERHIVKGRLRITWSPSADARGTPVPDQIEALDFRITSRTGQPAFEQVLTESFPLDPSGATRRPISTHPILVQDLDGDGRSEIVVAGANVVYRNRGQFKFDAEPFCEKPVNLINAGVLADFTGDGVPDLLAGRNNGDPMLFVADGRGRFTTSGVRIVLGPEPLRLPTSITAGDIDGDGDLDAWIGQYKPPYVRGAMPTPYYDANDGFPAVLLVNNGRGEFEDGTRAAGLDKKRYRRTYSSSFVDLDDDGDLDLIVVSDFAGVDLYANDGRGHFSDITASLGDKRHLFGMSHTFGDYDSDGRLDMYVIGMSSTTARRLDQLKLGRQEAQFAGHNRLRKEMGYGNRMYLARARGYEQAPFNDQIARTGWSWGSTSADFDNDGDVDIFVANGNRSGQSARDYCTRYWCHDAYTGTSQASEAAQRLFGDALLELNSLEISWNGFEHDVLWMNEGKASFLDIAFLMGVSFESDGRAVVSDDLDGDGRMDLIVEDFSQQKAAMTLRVLKNRWPTRGHWIGLRLSGGAPGPSPIGAKVTLIMPDGGRRVAVNTTGHSVWAQHANTVHFGLGPQTAVQGVEVTWPDRRVTKLARPQIDRYHTVRPPNNFPK